MDEPTIRRIRQEDHEEIKLACIREGGYQDTIGGRPYKFNEGEVIMTDRKFGLFLIRRARNAWNMGRQQSQMERKEYSQRAGSANLHVRDTALEYCDANGKPLTRAWPEPALVNLQTEEGVTAFGKWKAQHSPEKVNSPVRYDKPDDVDFTEEYDPGEMEVKDLQPPEAPNPTWSKDEKLEYVERHAEVTGLKAWSGLVKRDDMEPTLNKRVAETYQFLRERYQQGG